MFVNKPPVKPPPFSSGAELIVDARRHQVDGETELAGERVVVGIEAALITLEAIADDDALLVEVVERGAILCRRRAAGEREIVVGRDTVMQDGILPVRIGGADARIRAGGQLSRRDLGLHEVAELRGHSRCPASSPACAAPT